MAAWTGRIAVIIAVDTSVLAAIYKGEATGDAWLGFLEIQRAIGQLVACEVVVAEFAAFFPRPDDVADFLNDLVIGYDALSPQAAIRAGSLFRAYRREGGPREHMIPDFLIGAHASVQANRLAAADRGFLRRYFPRLTLVSPH